MGPGSRWDAINATGLNWNELARHGRISLVRRPSGGRAVIHAGGLTYALI